MVRAALISVNLPHKQKFKATALIFKVSECRNKCEFPSFFKMSMIVIAGYISEYYFQRAKKAAGGGVFFVQCSISAVKNSVVCILLSAEKLGDV